MAASQEVREIAKMTTEEATQALTMGDAPKGTRIVVEIPKSLCMLRLKKDKQTMIHVYVSLRNLLCTKLTMEEKGKAVGNRRGGGRPIGPYN